MAAFVKEIDHDQMIVINLIISGECPKIKVFPCVFFDCLAKFLASIARKGVKIKVCCWMRFFIE